MKNDKYRKLFEKRMKMIERRAEDPEVLDSYF